MDKNDKPVILNIGKRGCYIIMSPNFEKGQFEETNELIRAADVSTFGFIERIKHKQETQVKCFKDFMEELYTIAGKKHIEHVLVKITEEYENYAGLCWIGGFYQLLVLNKISKDL